MRNRYARWMMVTACVWLAVAAVSGQGPAYRAPRTTDGKPNLNGIWQAINSAHWDIEAHSAAPGVLNEQLGAAYSIPGGHGVVEGDLPYRPEALAKKRENFTNRLKLDPEVKCYLPGVPRAMYMPYPFQIAQNPKHVMMFFEFAGAVRTIYMDNAEQIAAPADSWMGWSNGRWTANLGIDTKGTWIDLVDRRQSPQRCAAHVDASPAQRRHAAVRSHVDDPKVFTRPLEVIMRPTGAWSATRSSSNSLHRVCGGRGLWTPSQAVRQ